jgi:hypothetical protein
LKGNLLMLGTKKLGILLLAFSASSLGAQTSKLPKGPSTSLSKQKAVQAGNKSDEKEVTARTCHADFLNPPGSSGSFTSDGKFLYILLNAAKVIDLPSAKKKTSPKLALKKPVNWGPPRQTLYKITLEGTSVQAEALLSLGVRQDAVLVTYGEPPQGLTTVVHLPVASKNAGIGCFDGPAGTVTVSFSKEGAKAVHGTGEIQIALGPAGFWLVDATKNQILEIDPATFQTRSMYRVPSGERPLYFDPHGPQLFTFKRGASEDEDLKKGTAANLKASQAVEERSLLVRGIIPDKVSRQMKLKVNDRLVQDGRYFAVVQLDSGANALTLIEVPGWNDGAKPGTFNLQLPSATPIADAGMSIDIKKRRALVYGATARVKRKWGKIFIYDYGKGKQLAAVAAPKKQYIHYAAFDRSGERIILELRDLATSRSVMLKTFDFKNGRLSNIVLPPPPSMAKAPKKS